MEGAYIMVSDRTLEGEVTQEAFLVEEKCGCGLFRHAEAPLLAKQKGCLFSLRNASAYLFISATRSLASVIHCTYWPESTTSLTMSFSAAM